MKKVHITAQVDGDKCISCRVCKNVCPAGAIEIVDKQDVKKMFVSPCQDACPAGVNVEAYIALTGAGKIREAYHLIRRENPFPSVCGHICTHPCETKCNRGLQDEPVSIIDIKRYVADYAFENGLTSRERAWAKNSKSVGIIGAGPSGLSCAYYLALTGYSVEVYESQPVAGGVLAFGIPQYRLPKEVLQRDIDLIEQAGVKIHLNTEVGKDVTFNELKKKHNAVYIATGTQISNKVGIPGEGLQGVYYGLDFLRDVNLGKKPVKGRKVVVIGGGNVAVDVARTALRLGAKSVEMVCLEQRDEMPALPEEVEATLEEGIRIHNGWGPRRILDKEAAVGIELKKCTSVFDVEGCFSPTYDENTLKTLSADRIIIAIGQALDKQFVSHAGIETEQGNFKVDKNMMTTIPGVFSGGDVVKGSNVVIAAIADGKKAVQSIHNYLGAQGMINKGSEIVLPERPDELMWNHNSRNKIKCLPPFERKNSFDEVVLGFTQEQIMEESRRCLGCGTTVVGVDADKCVACVACVDACGENAITYVPRQETKILRVDPADIDPAAIEAICRKAHIRPDYGLCACNANPPLAKEVAAAILKGASSPEEITRKTGTRGSCAMWCIAPMLQLLRASGADLTPPKGYKWYPALVGIWDISDEVARKYPEFHLEEDLQLFDQGQKNNLGSILK